MKVPYSWLAEFVELSEPEATAEMLTSAGMKVEKIHRMGEGLEGVVAGTVVSIEPHPNADKLTLVNVRIGDKDLRVVCGATNFSPGDKVPVATPGSRLPALGTLEARKIRGIASEGMLCSAMELGLGEDHSGILLLEPAAQDGEDVRALLGLTDSVLELEITPNRPDAMSLMGIAREVAACTGAALKKPAYPTKEGGKAIEDLVKVEVRDAEGCPRYLARVVEGVAVGPSPPLVQRRLTLAGIRPISNVVDATNYGMLVTGHPMHAFDLDRLGGAAIIVRRAQPGERLTGIDGIDRALQNDDLVIADASTPVALAGLMGGLETSVTEGTTRVALESAFFDPASIFRSSKRHNLRTESSARFERGADPNNVDFAASVATSYLMEWAGGDRASGEIDIYPDPAGPSTVSMRPERARAVLGIDLETREMTEALNRLGLEVAANAEVLEVQVPTRRRDLLAEEDLFEEIARVIGYDRIPATLPAGRNRAALPSRRRLAIKSLNAALTGAGLYEARTSILVGQGELEALGLSSPVFRVSNPLTKDESVLRPSLLPGLVSSIRRNFLRRNLDVRLFEVGNVFVKVPQRYEPLRLGIVMGGEESQKWYSAQRTIDFFDLKGVIQVLLSALGIESFELSENASPPYHPGRSASVTAEGRHLGVFGEIGKSHLRALDSTYPVQLAEFDLEELLAIARPLTPGQVRSSRFPPVLLDLAVSVPERTNAEDVARTARETGGDALETVRLIDVYRGEQAGSGRKSLAFSLSFRRPDRTLEESEAIRARDEIIAAIQAEHEGRIRG